MLIKCFKKSSFRNSPFSSLSPAPAPGDLGLPVGAHIPSWADASSLVALCSSRYQSPLHRDLPGVPAGWGLSQAHLSLGHTISSHVFVGPGCPRSRDGSFPMSGVCRAIRCCFACVCFSTGSTSGCQHEVQKGAYTGSRFKKTARKGTCKAVAFLQQSMFALKSQLCRALGSQCGVSLLWPLQHGQGCRGSANTALHKMEITGAATAHKCL